MATPELTRRAALLGITAATTIGLVTQAEAGGQMDLTGLHTDFKIVPLANGASIVQLIFDLAEWQKNVTAVVRHFCPPGVDMSSQGFSILSVPGIDGSPFGLRNNILLNNMRNLMDENGGHGFSWYIRNNGDTVGAVRLEISFVARDLRP